MHNYNIYVQTETEKYDVLATIRAAGGIVTGVSGCGTGYYIQLDATPAQVHEINAKLKGAA